MRLYVSRLSPWWMFCSKRHTDKRNGMASTAHDKKASQVEHVSHHTDMRRLLLAACKTAHMAPSVTMDTLHASHVL